MTNNRSYLEQLPQDITSNEVSTYLDKQAIGRLLRTSKTIYKLFQEPSEIRKLLFFIQEENYVEAEKK